MILLDRESHERLVEAILGAFESGHTAEWERHLASSPYVDGFGAVLDDRIRSKLFHSRGPHVLSDWLLDIRPWLDKVTSPTYPVTIENGILYSLWDTFQTTISTGLRNAHRIATIPDEGGVLAFVGYLSTCIVLKYQFAGPYPSLFPVAVIDEPKSVFDVWPAIDQASPASRNSLKAILTTGHKMVAQRGLLIHVDRRMDSGVFGPSIDTLVLVETLLQEAFRRQLRPTRVLDIGSGSGMLAAALYLCFQEIQELFAIDSSLQAIACTTKNLRITEDPMTKPVHLWTGHYDARLLKPKFDIVACNPPYIPLPPNHHPAGSPPAFLEAVSGLELIRHVLKNLDGLLGNGGHLLLMTSSVCLRVVEQWIPSDVKVEYPLGEDGYEAVFDVEAVLESPHWLRYLQSECNLVSKGGAYFHRLHPLWIEYSGKDSKK